MPTPNDPIPDEPSKPEQSAPDVHDEGSVAGEAPEAGAEASEPGGEGSVAGEVAEVRGEGVVGGEASGEAGTVSGAEVPGRPGVEGSVAGEVAEVRGEGVVGGEAFGEAGPASGAEVPAAKAEVRGGVGFRSGFVTLVGRPNVGKSTLLNQILGQKVTIVSDKPQTTRHRIQGVLNRPGAQIVFVDTPGLHKPRTTLGERLNDTAKATISDVDAVVFVLDATQPFGRGDAWVAERLPKDAVVAVNKTDIAKPDQVLGQLAKAGELEMSAYFPISAAKGKGVPELVDHLLGLMPEGPQYFPDDMISDVPEAFWVAELVREQLLAVAREELPHSIATRVTEWEWPYIRCEIVVERDSQKGIVVGKGGDLLKRVGTAVRAQLPPGAYLDLHVTVDKNWQRRPAALDRLGF